MAQQQRSHDGAVLFRNFAASQTGIEEVRDSQSATQMSSRELQEVENELSEITQQFAQTDGRQRVRTLARKVKGMTLKQAFSILKNVIAKTQHAIESVVVVFTFCADLVKLAWEKCKETFMTVVDWCCSTISSLLEPVVQACGGWRNLLIGAAAAFISGALIFGVVAILL